MFLHLPEQMRELGCSSGIATFFLHRDFKALKVQETWVWTSRTADAVPSCKVWWVPLAVRGPLSQLMCSPWEAGPGNAAFADGSRGLACRAEAGRRLLGRPRPEGSSGATGPTGPEPFSRSRLGARPQRIAESSPANKQRRCMFTICAHIHHQCIRQMCIA